MKQAAALALAGELLRDRLIEGREVQGCADDIAKHARIYMDGYELATMLDRACYWDCDLAMAEALDSWSGLARLQIETAEKEWAQRNDVKPPLANGTRVKYAKGTGTIDKPYEHGAAKYLIIEDADALAADPSRRRLILNFEDCAAIP